MDLTAIQISLLFLDNRSFGTNVCFEALSIPDPAHIAHLIVEEAITIYSSWN